MSSSYIKDNKEFLRQKLNWLLAKLEPAAAAIPDLEIGRWAKVIVCFSFASAIQIAILFAQLHSHLLPTFHFLSLSILFGFASFFISKVINSEFPNAARVLEAASLFFVVTAFFIAISIPFPLYLKLIVLVVYAVCLIFVLRALCNHFYR